MPNRPPANFYGKSFLNKVKFQNFLDSKFTKTYIIVITKTFNIMLENIEIPAGMQEVTDVTTCDSFNKEYRGGILFLKGDKIQCGSRVATSPFTHKVNGKDVTDQIPYIACSINGKEPKFVARAAGRKRRREISP